MNGSWHISVDFLISRFWPAVVFIAAIILSILYYRTTVPPLGKRIKILLTVLRSLSLGILLLLCFQPLLKSIHTFDEKSKLLFLIDRTESMQIRENGIKRIERVQNILDTPGIRNLEDACEVKAYVFDPMLHLLSGDIDTTGTFGKSTDLTKVLRSAAALDPDGILLFSDGRITQGEDPAVFAGDLDFPIYSLCIGEAKNRPDSRILRVHAPSVAYAGDTVSVIIHTAQQGYAGQRSTLQLLEDGKIQAEKMILLPQDGFGREDTLTFYPSKPGNALLTVEMAAQPGESIRANNHSTLSIDILKNRFRVLLLADAPSPDYVLVKRLLESEKRIDLIGGAFKDENTLYDSSIRPDAWGEIDALILLNLPSRTISQAYQQALRRLFDQQKPYLLFAGTSFDPRSLSDLGAASPVSQLIRGQNHPVQPQLTSDGQFHVIFNPSEAMAPPVDFNQLPPLYSSWSRLMLRPETQILLQDGTNGKAASSVRTKSPIFATLQTPQSRSAAFFADGFYRWTLLPNIDGRSILSSLLKQTILWLCAEESSNIRLHVEDTPVSGIPFHLAAEVYDDAQKPLRGAEVICSFKSKNGMDSLALAEINPGYYEGSLSIPDPAKVSITVKAAWNGRKIGEAVKAIYFAERNEEFSDFRSDPELLSEIARTTGGYSGPPDSLQSALAHLHLPAQEKEIRHSFALYHHPWIYILLVLLLCSEWLIRKRLGMV